MSADTKRLPEPLERATQTFSGRTVEVLREMVVSGQLRPGERLNEVELANALGISRGPLREAIQRLHSEGLLTTVANRGAYVRVITPSQLTQLYEVRIALETHAVRLAVKVADDDDITALDQMLDRARSSIGSGKAYPYDQDFHQRFIALAANQALEDTTVEVLRQIDMARAKSGHEPNRARQALAEHREIVEQLVRRKAEAAAKAVDRHLRSSLASALQILGQDEGAPADSPASS